MQHPPQKTCASPVLAELHTLIATAELCGGGGMNVATYTDDRLALYAKYRQTIGLPERINGRIICGLGFMIGRLTSRDE